MQEHLAQILLAVAALLAATLGAVLYLVSLLRARGDAAGPLKDELARLDQVLRQEFSSNRTESQQSLKSNLGDFRDAQARLLDSVAQRVQSLSESNERRLTEIRAAVDEKLSGIQKDNAARLEEMRRTVDEKLHATLETRLGQAFSTVGKTLEQVHKDLGEMQKLAGDVGGLSRVLTNVKARGVWGELQLERILQEMLTAGQYERNFHPKPGSKESVEFAIRLPGQDAEAVWLPVDSKLPREDYERLTLAQEKGDAAAVEAAAKALETVVKAEARSIRDKYIAPPRTTDFAVLFLPVESLYAEVLRRPGLAEGLQREMRVVVAGPTTFAALLNSLQMGFRSVAIQKRASEIERLLAAVKTEMGKLGEAIDKTHQRFEALGKDFEAASKRTKTIERKLKGVDALPESEAAPLLDNGAAAPDETA